MSARSTVEAIIACWNTQDVELTMAYISDDAVYALYVSEQTVPFAGVSEGKDAIRSTLYMMLEQFDYLRFDRAIVAVNGDVVRVQTQFKFHHRRTGQNLEGSMRTVFTVRDGLVVRCDEYLDEELLDAFMRLVRHREAVNDIVAPPQMAGHGAPRREKQAAACDEECREPRVPTDRERK